MLIKTHSSTDFVSLTKRTEKLSSAFSNQKLTQTWRKWALNSFITKRQRLQTLQVWTQTTFYHLSLDKVGIHQIKEQGQLWETWRTWIRLAAKTLIHLQVSTPIVLVAYWTTSLNSRWQVHNKYRIASFSCCSRSATRWLSLLTKKWSNGRRQRK